MVICVHITGNLTINVQVKHLHQVLENPGMYVYVGGDLILNGTISMKARGANHSN